MRAVQKRTPGAGVVLSDIAAEAQPAAGEVAVRIHAAGICGSDLHAWAWDSGYDFMAPFLPLTLGHEFSGTVTATGTDVYGIAVGDAVVCWPTVTCGECPACRKGRRAECMQRRVIGLHRDGGFAERVTMPAANALPLPAGLPMDVAALAEPLAVSVNAVNVAGAGAGDRVLVLGPGPIGMGIALVAQARGAQVLLAGFDDDARLALARRLGIAGCADLARTDLDSAIAAHFGAAPDIVLEATGRSASVSDGLRVLRPGGVLAVVGIHAQPLELDLNQLVRGKKQLRGCHDSTPEAFAEAIRRLTAEPALYAGMITHRLPLAEAEDGFALARSGAALKVMLFPAGGPND